MDFSNEEIPEFKNDCIEMLDESESIFLQGLQQMSQEHYNIIFRCFHSLKGGAGMFGFKAVQIHMHNLENEFLKFKDEKKFSSDSIAFFLNGIDKSRILLENLDIEEIEDLVAPPTSMVPPPVPTSKPIKVITDLTDTKQSKKDPSKGLIYCIDDEPEILEILLDILEGENYECKIFEKANELMTQIKIKQPDLVFSDMKMPETSGLEVLGMVKKINPDIPVIFLSGFLDKNTLIESMNSGVFSALEKPFNETSVLTSATNAIKFGQLLHNFNKSINLILYQFSDLDDFLKISQKEEIRQNLRKDIEQLFEIRKNLRYFKKV